MPSNNKDSIIIFCQATTKIQLLHFAKDTVNPSITPFQELLRMLPDRFVTLNTSTGHPWTTASVSTPMSGGTEESPPITPLLQTDY